MRESTQAEIQRGRDMTRMTDYDCAAHIAGVGPKHGVKGDEYLAAVVAVNYDTHYRTAGYTKPTDADRKLIRTASNRLNRTYQL